MKKTPIISIFFLVIFLTGLYHQMVPHCHEFLAGEHQAAHHHQKHHRHSPENTLDHSHIAHDDHLDAGVFDLFLCILSDMEHPATDCMLFHFVATKVTQQTKSSAGVDHTVDVAPIFTSLSTPVLSLQVVFFDQELNHHSAPPLGNLPSRGPPHFSC
jgi:hypothetical protein